MSDRPVTQAQLDRVLATVGELAAENLVLRQRVAALEDTVQRLAREDFEVVGSTVSAASTTSSSLGVGRWLRRCLNGEPRGPSGRDQTSQPSRYYLVCKGVDLTVYNPLRLFTSWAEAKPFCQLRGQPSDAIYVGLPTQEETRIAVREPGLELPAALRQ